MCDYNTEVTLCDVCLLQVTLEEQMICGALQTLNEEACEDVMDEAEEVETSCKVTSSAPPSELGESSVIINFRTRSGDKDGNGLGDIHKIQDFIWDVMRYYFT